jgi:hypothetical protein
MKKHFSNERTSYVVGYGELNLSGFELSAYRLKVIATPHDTPSFPLRNGRCGDCVRVGSDEAEHSFSPQRRP